MWPYEKRVVRFGYPGACSTNEVHVSGVTSSRAAILEAQNSQINFWLVS